MRRVLFALTLAILVSACGLRTSKQNAITESAHPTPGATRLSTRAEIEEFENSNNFFDTTVTILHPKRNKAPKRMMWMADIRHKPGMRYPLYGDVASVVFTDLPANQGEKAEEECSYYFDKRGNCYGISYYMLSDSNDASRVEYEYDKEGRLIGQSATNYHGTHQLSPNFKYDERGNLTEHVLYSGVWPCKLVKYKYDSNDNLIEYEEEYNTTKIYYKYDSRANIIEMTEYFKGTWLERSRFKYDANDNLVLELSYDIHGKYIHKRLYKYDEKGNMYEKVRYNEVGKKESEARFKHDTKGNVIEDSYGNRYIITYYK
jgi:YD repeat-containing protein